jgi:hypothetical protein
VIEHAAARPCYEDRAGAVRTDAGGATRGRKVRAPQGRVLVNDQARRLDGKWHREETAVARR